MAAGAGESGPAAATAVVPQGKVLFEERFENLAGWHLEGNTNRISIMPGGGLRIDCTGSAQGGIGAHAICRRDFPDRIALSYDLFVETRNGLLITFLALRGTNGADAIAGVPPREGWFREYTGKDAAVRSYHVSLSRYDDAGVHTGVSNWRRNPGLHLMADASDPCKEIRTPYRVVLIKDGARCQLQVDGRLVSDFTDPGTLPGPLPDGGKIGFRAIGAEAIVRIANLRVTALE
jgi:hypothetical protein